MAFTHKSKLHPRVAARVAIERKICRKACQAFLAAGYLLGVNDGEETTIIRSSSLTDIMRALSTTDEDYLLIFDPARKASDGGAARVGYIYFVYGNSGYDVISDYSAKEELFERFREILAPVDEYAKKFDV